MRTIEHVHDRLCVVRHPPDSHCPTVASQHPYRTCPRCRWTTYSVHDIRYGYCGNCHDFTGEPPLDRGQAQDSLSAQIERVVRMAEIHGEYDAADWIKAKLAGDVAARRRRMGL